MAQEEYFDGVKKNPEGKRFFKNARKSLIIFGLGTLASLGVMRIAGDVGRAGEKHLKKAVDIAAAIGDPSDQAVLTAHPVQAAEYSKQENAGLNDISTRSELRELAIGVMGVSAIPIIVFAYGMGRENGLEPEPQQDASVAA